MSCAASAHATLKRVFSLVCSARAWRSGRAGQSKFSKDPLRSSAPPHDATEGLPCAAPTWAAAAAVAPRGARKPSRRRAHRGRPPWSTRCLLGPALLGRARPALSRLWSARARPCGEGAPWAASAHRCGLCEARRGTLPRPRLSAGLGSSGGRSRAEEGSKPVPATGDWLLQRSRCPVGRASADARGAWRSPAQRCSPHRHSRP